MKILKMSKVALEKYKKSSLPLKASLWFTICSIIQKGISIITMPIFTRLMSTEQYGEYNIFLTWYNIFLLIVTLNIHTEIFNKGLIDNDTEKDTYTINQVGLLIFLTGIFLLLYICCHRWIDRLLGLSQSLVIIMILEILGSAIVALWTARKRFDYEYKKIVAVTVGLAVLTQGSGIIAVMLSDDKVSAKIYTNALVPIAASLIILISFARKSKFWGHWYWWKTAVLAALPLLPHYLSLVMLNQSDKLLIDYFISAEKAAIYSVAHSAGLFMTIINNSINGAFVPWAYGKMKYEKGNGIKKVSNSLFMLVMFVNAALIWVAPEAIKLLAAPQYSEAVYCLIPIAMSVYFYFVYTLFVDIEIYYGANQYVAIASIVAAMLNSILNYILIPLYGYFVAGYITLLSYFTTMLLHYIFLRKVMKKHELKETDLFDGKNIFTNAILLIVLSVIAALLYSWPMIRYLIILLAIVAVYVKRNVLLCFIKEMRSERP